MRMAYCRNIGCDRKAYVESTGKVHFWCSIRCRDTDPMWKYAPVCPFCGNRCPPRDKLCLNWYDTCGSCVGYLKERGDALPSTRDPQPIRFYRSGEPYEEFSNFHRCRETIMLDVWALSGSDRRVRVSSRFSESIYQALKIWYITGDVAEMWAILGKTAREAFDHVRSPGVKDLIRENPERERWFHGHRDDTSCPKLELMRAVVKAKVTCNPYIKNLLLDTGKARLEEASPHDSYWGVYEGRGKNHLGVILMEIREELRDGDYRIYLPEPYTTLRSH